MKAEAEDEEEEDEEEEEKEEEDEELESNEAKDNPVGSSSTAAHTSQPAQDVDAGETSCSREFEVQGCTAACTYPCMDGCQWDKCVVLQRERLHWTIRMLDNGDELRVLKRHVRECVADPEELESESSGGHASRQRKLNKRMRET